MNTNTNTQNYMSIESTMSQELCELFKPSYTSKLLSSRNMNDVLDELCGVTEQREIEEHMLHMKHQKAELNFQKALDNVEEAEKELVRAGMALECIEEQMSKPKIKSVVLNESNQEELLDELCGATEGKELKEHQKAEKEFEAALKGIERAEEELVKAGMALEDIEDKIRG